MFAELLRRLGPTMAVQHGVVGLAQAEAAGFTAKQLAQWVGRGLLARRDRAVYAVPGSPVTWRSELMVAVLAAPTGAVASHRSAALLLGVGELRDVPTEISIPAGARFRRDGVVAHESSDLSAADVRVLDGIPTTGPLRLALDVGSVVTTGKYRSIIHDLRHHHGVDWPDLLRTYARHHRRGRNGCGALYRVVKRYYGLTGVPETVLERIALDLILDAGLPPPVAQYEVVIGGRRYRTDYAWPDALQVLEVDGPHHADPVVQAADAARDAAFEAAGWTVHRFDHRTVLEAPGRFIADLSAALMFSRQ